jgi:hypothetical protein
MSELTIPLTRCNKASCDRAESGEFTSVALIGFSPPPERPGFLQENYQFCGYSQM